MLTAEDDEPGVSVAAPVAHDWLVRDRLTSAEIDQLVKSFEEEEPFLN